MPNTYDVLYRRPVLNRRLKSQQERLARNILNSGRLRIDADKESNFVRLQSPADRINMTFSWREVNDAKLGPAAHARLLAALEALHPPEEAKKRCNFLWEKVHNDFKRKSPVAQTTELMVARAFVLCNELPVIRLIHLESAEIFISFGHTVSDVLDVATWQEVGENNGLQAFGKGQNAVYVSCGGHPFLDHDERNYTTDGFPALARFLVVAAQETGHNADMIRNPAPKGPRWLGRHSAADWGRAPSAKAGPARRNDAQATQNAFRKCRNLGINLIAEWERHLQFYRQNKLYNLRRLSAWLKCRLGWLLFTTLLRLQGFGRLCTLPRTPTPATQLRTCLHDMEFNITPNHEAYRRNDPSEHEAMLCMEALARVPQQVIKWGHKATSQSMPALYRLYYGEVIPSVAAAVNRAERAQKPSS